MVRANMAALARLSPIEKEYRALMARISSYKKFIRERESVRDDQTCVHRKTYLRPTELHDMLTSCQERAAEIKPQCAAALVKRRKARTKTKNVDPDYVPSHSVAVQCESTQRKLRE
jgi:hypothetical protein